MLTDEWKDRKDCPKTNLCYLTNQFTAKVFYKNEYIIILYQSPLFPKTSASSGLCETQLITYLRSARLVLVLVPWCAYTGTHTQTVIVRQLQFVTSWQDKRIVCQVYNTRWRFNTKLSIIQCIYSVFYFHVNSIHKTDKMQQTLNARSPCKKVVLPGHKTQKQRK